MKTFFLILLLAFSSRAATVTGKLIDCFGVTGSPLVTFTPDSTPLVGGGAMILDVQRNARPSNGVFIVTLMGGYYDVTFGSGGKTVQIAVPADTNSYNFTNLLNLATFTYPNIYGSISSRVTKTNGITITTNNAGLYNESITLGSSGGGSTNFPIGQVGSNFVANGFFTMKVAGASDIFQILPQPDHYDLYFNGSKIQEVSSNGSIDVEWGAGGLKSFGNIETTHGSLIGDASGLGGTALSLTVGSAVNADNATIADRAQSLDSGIDYEVNNMNVDGKLTSVGGFDPPLVLFDSHTRAETKVRVLLEIPDAFTNVTYYVGTNALSNVVSTSVWRHQSRISRTNIVPLTTNVYIGSVTNSTNIIPSKLTGAAQYFCSDTRQMEFYIGASNIYYDLQGNVLNGPSDLEVLNATVAILKTPQFLEQRTNHHHSRK